MNRLALITAAPTLPALIADAGEPAALRFLEFFADRIRNLHTRRAYSHVVAAFLAWCDDAGVPSIAAMQPLHMASWIDLQQQEHATPTVRQRLAALRDLFDRLVTGRRMEIGDGSQQRTVNSFFVRPVLT